MKHSFYCSPLVATLIGFAVLSPSAHAELYQAPGIRCVEANHNSSRPELNYDFGNVRNSDTQNSKTMNCPIFRRAPDSNTITGLVITVDDRSNSSVTCDVRSCNNLGTSCSSAGIAQSPTSQFGFFDLQPGGGSVAGFSNGYSYFTCTIPKFTDASKQSGIMSYRWND